MDQILPHIPGLPWGATFALVLMTLLIKWGVDAGIRWLRFRFEERQYGDSEARLAREALIGELKGRIEKLEWLVKDLQASWAEDRLAYTTMLADEKEAHADAKLEQEKLRGVVAVMQERLDALVRHEKVQVPHQKRINEAIKKLDPTAVLPEPIEPINGTK